MQKTRKSYYGAAIAAFSIWGLFSFALKPLKVYASIDILFYRVFFAASMLLFYAYILRSKKMKENHQRFNLLTVKQKKRTIYLTLFGGALLTGNWFVFIFVINQVSIKAAAYAYLVCPILTTLIAYFVLKEKLLKNQWVAIGISILSIIILAIYNFKDLLFSMIVAVSYSLYLVSQRKNIYVDKLPILTYQMVFSAFILLPFYPTFSAPLPTESLFYILIALIAVMFTIIPLLLNLYAIEGLPSATVGILLYLNPILNFVVAIIFFDEKTTFSQLVSYSLVALSIAVFNQHLFKKKQVEI